MNQRIIILLLIVVFCLTSGISLLPQGKPVISILTSQASYKDADRKIADAIEKKLNIKIEFQVVPDDQYHNLVKTKLATNEVSDIIQRNIPQEYVNMNVNKNMVDLSKESWVPRLVNAKLIKDENGKIWGLPRESSSFFGACYYNKKIFKELNLKEPVTYKEFLALLEKIKNSGKGIIPIYMSNKDTWTTQIFMTLGCAVAVYDKQEIWAKILTNGMKFSDVPEFKEILTMFLDLYKKGYVNKDHLSATYDSSKVAVGEGKAAMVVQGEWFASDMYSKYPDIELGAFIIPFMDKQIMGTGSYVLGSMIVKSSKNIDLAKKVLNLWSQPEYNKIFWQENPGFPAFVDVKSIKVIPCVENLLNKYIKTGKYTTEMDDRITVARPILQEWWNLFVDMVSGGRNPEEVLIAWDEKFADFMSSKHMPGWE